MKDIQAAFDKYLAKGKPAYVSHRWASLEDAIAWIRAAGGVAVLAHPGRYDLKPCSATRCWKSSGASVARRSRW